MKNGIMRAKEQKKRICAAAVLAVVLVLGLIYGIQSAANSPNTLTIDDVEFTLKDGKYGVSSAEQLLALGKATDPDQTRGNTFELTEDITVDGLTDARKGVFAGTLEGNGYMITYKNVKIVETMQDNSTRVATEMEGEPATISSGMLFGSLAEGATVENLFINVSDNVSYTFANSLKAETNGENKINITPQGIPSNTPEGEKEILTWQRYTKDGNEYTKDNAPLNLSQNETKTVYYGKKIKADVSGVSEEEGIAYTTEEKKGFKVNFGVICGTNNGGTIRNVGLQGNGIQANTNDGSFKKTTNYEVVGRDQKTVVSTIDMMLYYKVEITGDDNPTERKVTQEENLTGSYKNLYAKLDKEGYKGYYVSLYDENDNALYEKVDGKEEYDLSKPSSDKEKKATAFPNTTYPIYSNSREADLQLTDEEGKNLYYINKNVYIPLYSDSKENNFMTGMDGTPSQKVEVHYVNQKKEEADLVDVYSKEEKAVKSGEVVEEGKYVEEGKVVEEGKYVEEGKVVEEGKYVEEGKSVEEGKYVEEGKVVEEGKYIEEGKSVEEGVCKERDGYLIYEFFYQPISEEGKIISVDLNTLPNEQNKEIKVGEKKDKNYYYYYAAKESGGNIAFDFTKPLYYKKDGSSEEFDLTRPIYIKEEGKYVLTVEVVYPSNPTPEEGDQSPEEGDQSPEEGQRRATPKNLSATSEITKKIDGPLSGKYYYYYYAKKGDGSFDLGIPLYNKNNDGTFNLGAPIYNNKKEDETGKYVYDLNNRTGADPDAPTKNETSEIKEWVEKQYYGYNYHYYAVKDGVFDLGTPLYNTKDDGTFNLGDPIYKKKENEADKYDLNNRTETGETLNAPTKNETSEIKKQVSTERGENYNYYYATVEKDNKIFFDLGTCLYGNSIGMSGPTNALYQKTTDGKFELTKKKDGSVNNDATVEYSESKASGEKIVTSYYYYYAVNDEGFDLGTPLYNTKDDGKFDLGAPLYKKKEDEAGKYDLNNPIDANSDAPRKPGETSEIKEQATGDHYGYYYYYYAVDNNGILDFTTPLYVENDGKFDLGKPIYTKNGDMYNLNNRIGADPDAPQKDKTSEIRKKVSKEIAGNYYYYYVTTYNSKGHIGFDFNNQLYTKEITEPFDLVEDARFTQDGDQFDLNNEKTKNRMSSQGDKKSISSYEGEQATQKDRSEIKSSGERKIVSYYYYYAKVENNGKIRFNLGIPLYEKDKQTGKFNLGSPIYTIKSDSNNKYAVEYDLSKLVVGDTTVSGQENMTSPVKEQANGDYYGYYYYYYAVDNNGILDFAIPLYVENDGKFDLSNPIYEKKDGEADKYDLNKLIAKGKELKSPTKNETSEIRKEVSKEEDGNYKYMYQTETKGDKISFDLSTTVSSENMASGEKIVTSYYYYYAVKNGVFDLGTPLYNKCDKNPTQFNLGAPIYNKKDDEADKYDLGSPINSTSNVPQKPNETSEIKEQVNGDYYGYYYYYYAVDNNGILDFTTPLYVENEKTENEKTEPFDLSKPIYTKDGDEYKLNELTNNDPDALPKDKTSKIRKEVSKEKDGNYEYDYQTETKGDKISFDLSKTKSPGDMASGEKIVTSYYYYYAVKDGVFDLGTPLYNKCDENPTQFNLGDPIYNKKDGEADKYDLSKPIATGEGLDVPQKDETSPVKEQVKQAKNYYGYYYYYYAVDNNGILDFKTPLYAKNEEKGTFDLSKPIYTKDANIYKLDNLTGAVGDAPQKQNETSEIRKEVSKEKDGNYKYDYQTETKGDKISFDLSNKIESSEDMASGEKIVASYYYYYATEEKENKIAFDYSKPLYKKVGGQFNLKAPIYDLTTDSNNIGKYDLSRLIDESSNAPQEQGKTSEIKKLRLDDSEDDEVKIACSVGGQYLNLYEQDKNDIWHPLYTNIADVVYFKNTDKPLKAEYVQIKTGDTEKFNLAAPNNEANKTTCNVYEKNKVANKSLSMAEGMRYKNLYAKLNDGQYVPLYADGEALYDVTDDGKSYDLGKPIDNAANVAKFEGKTWPIYSSKRQEDIKVIDPNGSESIDTEHTLYEKNEQGIYTPLEKDMQPKYSGEAKTIDAKELGELVLESSSLGSGWNIICYYCYYALRNENKTITYDLSTPLYYKTDGKFDLTKLKKGAESYKVEVGMTLFQNVTDLPENIKEECLNKIPNAILTVKSNGKHLNLYADNATADGRYEPLYADLGYISAKKEPENLEPLYSEVTYNGKEHFYLAVHSNDKVSTVKTAEEITERYRHLYAYDKSNDKSNDNNNENKKYHFDIPLYEKDKEGNFDLTKPIYNDKGDGNFDLSHYAGGEKETQYATGRTAPIYTEGGTSEQRTEIYEVVEREFEKLDTTDELITENGLELKPKNEPTEFGNSANAAEFFVGGVAGTNESGTISGVVQSLPIKVSYNNNDTGTTKPYNTFHLGAIAGHSNAGSVSGSLVQTQLNHTKADERENNLTTEAGCLFGTVSKQGTTKTAVSSSIFECSINENGKNNDLVGDGSLQPNNCYSADDKTSVKGLEAITKENLKSMESDWTYFDTEGGDFVFCPEWQVQEVKMGFNELQDEHLLRINTKQDEHSLQIEDNSFHPRQYAIVKYRCLSLEDGFVDKITAEKKSAGGVLSLNLDMKDPEHKDVESSFAIIKDIVVQDDRYYYHQNFGEDLQTVFAPDSMEPRYNDILVEEDDDYQFEIKLEKNIAATDNIKYYYTSKKDIINDTVVEWNLKGATADNETVKRKDNQYRAYVKYDGNQNMQLYGFWMVNNVIYPPALSSINYRNKIAGIDMKEEALRIEKYYSGSQDGQHIVTDLKDSANVSNVYGGQQLSFVNCSRTDEYYYRFSEKPMEANATTNSIRNQIGEASVYKPETKIAVPDTYKKGNDVYLQLFRKQEETAVGMKEYHLKITDSRVVEPTNLSPSSSPGSDAVIDGAQVTLKMTDFAGELTDARINYIVSDNSTVPSFTGNDDAEVQTGNTVQLRRINNSDVCYLYVQISGKLDGANAYTPVQQLMYRLTEKSETPVAVPNTTTVTDGENSSVIGAYSIETGAAIKLETQADGLIVYCTGTKFSDSTLSARLVTDQTLLNTLNQTNEAYTTLQDVLYVKSNGTWYQMSAGSKVYDKTAGIRLENNSKKEMLYYIGAVNFSGNAAKQADPSDLVQYAYQVQPIGTTATPTAATVTDNQNPTEVLVGDSLYFQTETPDAEIYYTVNNTNPGTEEGGSTKKYDAEKGIIVEGAYNSSFIVKLVAVKKVDGKPVMNPSEVGYFVYKIVPSGHVQAPTATPATSADAPTRLTPGEKILLSTSTPGADIYYTTDGSTPQVSTGDGTGKNKLQVENGIKYNPTTGISMPAEGSGYFTIRAIAVKSGLLASEVAEFSYSYPGEMAAPYATPASGVVDVGTSVALKSNVEEAVIYYEVAYGKEKPKEPTMSSTIYNSAQPFIINQATTIKAMAMKDGVKSSTVTFTYTISGKLGAPTPSVESGSIVSRSTLLTLSSADGGSIYYTTDGSDPSDETNTNVVTGSVLLLDGDYGSVITVKTYAKKSGSSASDVATFTYQISKYQGGVTSDVEAGTELTPGATVNLISDVSDAVIYYTVDGSEPSNGSASGTAVTLNRNAGELVTIKAVAVPRSATLDSAGSATAIFSYKMKEGIVAPTASHSGGILTSAISVRLSAPEGNIYYTTDGSNPTANSMLYQEPITVNKTMTIKAIAITEEGDNSAIAVFSYQAAMRAAKPTSSLESQTVEPGTKVTLSSQTGDAAIYYSTDGTVPSMDNLDSLILYDGEGISINRTVTIQAVAYKEGLLLSNVASYSYDVTTIPAVEAKEKAEAQEEANALKETDVNGLSARHESEISGPSIEGVLLKEDRNGTCVAGTKETLPEKTKLVTRVKESSTGKVKKLRAALGEAYDIVQIYDMKLYCNEASIQPNGMVEIGIPIPKEYENAAVTIVYIDEEENVITYKTRRSGNMAYALTDHFSMYALAGVPGEKADRLQLEVTEVAMGAAALAMASGMIFAIVQLVHRRKYRRR